MNNIKNNIKGQFTICPNELLNDARLSRDAKYLFIWMASKPDDWTFYQKATADSIGCKDYTLRKYIDELCSCGWITKQRVRTDDGKFSHWHYTLNPHPVYKKPTVDKNHSGQNHTLTNKDLLTNKDIERETQKISFDDVMKMYVDTFGPNLCLTPNQGKHRRYIDELIGRGFAKSEFQKVMTAKKQEYDAGKCDTYVILPNALFKPDNFENNLAIINNPRKEAAKQNRKVAGKKVNDKFTKESTEKYKDGWI